MREILTIFTPTYNRMEQLSRLYNSLLNQSNKLFVWLIVDDGSTDDTEEYVNKWKIDADFTINYIRQSNMGKSYAHNVGVENTDTELFLCVDSDDYLDENAVDRVLDCWEKKSNRDIGILAFREVTRFEEKRNYHDLHVTLRDAQSKYKILGDTMLIYETKKISKYRFPYHEGEKFVPEAYLYDKLDFDGTMFVLPEVLYYGDYLNDGYTKNMSDLLKKNPEGYLDFITQRLRYDTGLFRKYMDTIRYLAIAISCNYQHKIRKSVYPMLTIFAYPFGYFLFCMRYKN